MTVTNEQNEATLVKFFENLIEELMKCKDKIHKKPSQKGRATAHKNRILLLMTDPYSQDRSTIKNHVKYFLWIALKRKSIDSEMNTLEELLNHSGWQIGRSAFLGRKIEREVRDMQRHHSHR